MKTFTKLNGLLRSLALVLIGLASATASAQQAQEACLQLSQRSEGLVHEMSDTVALGANRLRGSLTLADKDVLASSLHRQFTRYDEVRDLLEQRIFETSLGFDSVDCRTSPPSRGNSYCYTGSELVHLQSLRYVEPDGAPSVEVCDTYYLMDLDEVCVILSVEDLLSADNVQASRIAARELARRRRQAGCPAGAVETASVVRTLPIPDANSDIVAVRLETQAQPAK